MKISVDVEATPKELREFFGLPDVQPLQEEMLSKVRENMSKGMAGFDAVTLLKPFLPEHLQSMEGWQKAFWEQLAKNTQGAMKAGVTGGDSSSERDR